MQRSLRTATIAFAATVLVAVSATAASVLPDQAGQAADMTAVLPLEKLFCSADIDR